MTDWKQVIAERKPNQDDMIVDLENIVSIWISGAWYDYIGTSNRDGTHYVALGDDSTRHPLAFRCGTEQYARSIQRQLIEQGFQIAVFEEK